jgi:hypothetical protein
MARKFGKKNIVNRDLFSYNVYLLGDSGIGKSTLMANVMTKFCDDEEYIILNCGKEDGLKAINGVVWDQIDSYKDFAAFVKDVVENKETDYAKLRCVVIDTIDQLFYCSEKAVIDMWNRQNIGTKDFKPATTMNSAWNGFGKAEDKNIELILDLIWKLKAVGVAVWLVGHTRRRDNVDPITGLTYSTVTASMMTRYFEGVKTKMDICAICYINREMATKEYGKENVVTKKKKQVNEITSEARRIAFRSDNYVLDSKARFTDIVSEVPMDADAFVKAIQDAIDAAAGETKAAPAHKKAKLAPAPVEEEDDEEIIDDIEEEIEDEAPFDVEEDDDDLFAEDEEDFDPVAVRTEIRNLNKAGTSDQKKAVKAILAGRKLDSIDDPETLTAMLAVFE